MSTLSTSTAIQRIRLLSYLSENGPINTIEARAALNIFAPAARVKELRTKGYKIQTLFITALDSEGRAHQRVAKYVYCGEASEVNK